MDISPRGDAKLESARKRMRADEDHWRLIARPILLVVARLCNKLGLMMSGNAEPRVGMYSLDMPTHMNTSDAYAFCNGAFAEPIGGYYPSLSTHAKHPGVYFRRSRESKYTSPVAQAIWKEAVAAVINEAGDEQENCADELAYELFLDARDRAADGATSVRFQFDIVSQHPAIVKFVTHSQDRPTWVSNLMCIDTFFEKSLVHFRDDMHKDYDVTFVRVAGGFDVTVAKRVE